MPRRILVVRSAIAASSINGVGITEKRGAKCTSASHTVLKPSRVGLGRLCDQLAIALRRDLIGGLGSW